MDVVFTLGGVVALCLTHRKRARRGVTHVFRKRVPNALAIRKVTRTRTLHSALQGVSLSTIIDDSLGQYISATHVTIRNQGLP